MRNVTQLLAKCYCKTKDCTMITLGAEQKYLLPGVSFQKAHAKLQLILVRAILCEQRREDLHKKW